MKTYKFLCGGGIAPFTGARWPEPQSGKPGQWVEAAAVEPCRQGVHACALEDLPYWLQDELWEIELDGDVQRVGHKLVARRGRLIRHVDAWDGGTAREFSDDCVARTAEIAARTRGLEGHAADAVANATAGRAAVTGFIASRVAELDGGVDAYEAERSRQAAWLAERLRLGA
ncbi:MAG: hypothetical protein E6G14_10465 [Actinobacteria bacterium]|nr:MAG: hypothetical protein E6G14_10465 [Actinomycetota bacterium]